jgi:heavy metal sensor kinase
MMAKLPIRWRLTFWYATFLALALLLFGTAIYFAVRHEIYDSFEEELHNRTTAAQSAVNTESPNISVDSTAVANLRDDEHFIRLLTSDGEVIVDTSSDVGVPPPDPALIADVVAGNERSSKVEGAEGRFWVIATPIYRGDTVAGVLEVGSSSEDEDDLLKVLLVSLLVAAPVVLALASLGGYALAGRALRPVAEITELAQNISGERLDARIDLDLPDDELGRLARTFDAMLARIEDTFERQRQFTGDAAHELRTPLTLLRSQVDITLSRARSADEYRDALVAIDGDIDRLTGLVTTLLLLARTDTGKLVIDRVPFRIDETIRSLLDQYAPQAHSSGIELVRETTPDTVEGDEGLIFQVLINLLDNSFAHASTGGRIAIGNRNDGRTSEIWVDDDGAGISQEHLPRVFDRFYRVDTGRTRRDGGTGLGLAISKAIVEVHDGTIRMASSPGQGTRVTLTLPKTHLAAE